MRRRVRSRVFLFIINLLLIWLLSVSISQFAVFMLPFFLSCKPPSLPRRPAPGRWIISSLCLLLSMSYPCCTRRGISLGASKYFPWWKSRVHDANDCGCPFHTRSRMNTNRPCVKRCTQKWRRYTFKMPSTEIFVLITGLILYT